MRTLRIHNTLTGVVEPLVPRDGNAVGIYACGPTVYSRIHIGNARPYVIFSALKRFLAHEGYEPKLVINVTDINDKIYTAARASGQSSAQLATEMTAAYIKDTDALEFGRPDAEPLATEMIDSIVDLIAALIDRGHAYESDGDVYFSVPSWSRYGELSNRDPDSMEQGEDDNALKRDPRDFALWKAHKPSEDTHWPSPWGPGRPGWHIECSAMAEQLLGVDLDIHGGGGDLIFPHHENECAQTLAGRGKPLARVWMHNGMVRFTGEKMSKSVGNVWQLGEALDQYGADTIKLFLLSGHYRAPIECSEVTLAQTAASVDRIRQVGRRVDPTAPPLADEDDRIERFFAALADDFNTPAALAELYECIKAINVRCDAGERVAPGRLAEALGVFGLAGLLEETETPDAAALALLEQRNAARAAKDFATADRIRDELLAQGWGVRDGAHGANLVRV